MRSKMAFFVVCLTCAIGFVAAGSDALAKSYPLPDGKYLVSVWTGFGCQQSNCDDTSLSAYVGLPVNWVLTGRCEFRYQEPTPWSVSYVEVASGALPLGLRIDTDAQGHRAIVGVPERAGTWHLQIRFIGVSCSNGLWSWSGDNIQTLHITTEGSSSPRRVQ